LAACKNLCNNEQNCTHFQLESCVVDMSPALDIGIDVESDSACLTAGTCGYNDPCSGGGSCILLNGACTKTSEMVGGSTNPQFYQWTHFITAGGDGGTPYTTEPITAGCSGYAFADEGATRATPCPIGKTVSAGAGITLSLCTVKAGYYGVPGKGAATACGSGKSSNAGATDLLACYPLPGYWDADSAGDATQCPTGKTSPGGAAANADNVDDCKAAPGFFGSATDTTAYTACPAGKTNAGGLTSATNADNVDDCKAKPGFYGTADDTTTYAACPAGKTNMGGLTDTTSADDIADCYPLPGYWDADSAGDATQCPSGKTNAGGAGSAADANAISTCYPQAGFYGSGGSAR